MKSPRSEGDERPLPPLILPYIHSLQVLTNHKFKGSYTGIYSLYIIYVQELTIPYLLDFKDTGVNSHISISSYQVQGLTYRLVPDYKGESYTSTICSH